MTAIIIGMVAASIWTVVMTVSVIAHIKQEARAN